MKRGIILYILQCAGIALFLNSCDDTLSKVGPSIQPPEDLITVYTDTFVMKASTVRLDSVFSKTSDFLLGEMYDPVYGTLKADVLCQFYCEEGFKFPQTPNEGKIDSVELIIPVPLDMAYGDTLSPMELTVYPIDRPLKRNFYTNDNPENYCDMKNPLGKTSYTAYDLSMSDSLHKEGYYPIIRVKLPAELGQRFYDETIQNPSTFMSQNAFNEFFPGIYLTNTYGSGCIIKTVSDNRESGMYIAMYYGVMGTDINGNDSIMHRVQGFTVSKEVIQINRFVNDHIDQLLVDNPTHTYIKSPAAVCTKLVLPTAEMAKAFDINDRYINGFTLNLRYLPEDEWDFAYQPPAHLLLLPEDSVIPFFEKGNVDNYTTAFISFASASASISSSGYDFNTRTYHFGNISNLLKIHITNSPDKDLNLYIIPVTRKMANTDYGIYSMAISHSFYLSGVKIRTEEEDMKVVILSSKFEK